MDLTQEELDKNLNEWNLHYIRKQNQTKVVQSLTKVSDLVFECFLVVKVNGF